MKSIQHLPAAIISNIIRYLSHADRIELSKSCRNVSRIIGPLQNIGSNRNVSDQKIGNLLLDLAVKRNTEEFVSVLNSHLIPKSIMVKALKFLVINNHHPNLVIALLDTEPSLLSMNVRYYNPHELNPTEVDVECGSILHWATLYSHNVLVSYLLSLTGDDAKKHLDISTLLDQEGDGPLHNAASASSYLGLELLLESHLIDPNSKGSDGRYALHFAAELGCPESTSLLLEDKRTNIYGVDDDGDTPIHTCSFSNRLDVLDILLSDLRINPGSLNHKKRSPLHLSALMGHVAVTKRLLMDPRVDPLAEDIDGLSALDNAAIKGHCEIIRVFVEDGRMSEEFEKAFRFALAYDHRDVVQLLVTQDSIFILMQDKFDYYPIDIE